MTVRTRPSALPAAPVALVAALVCAPVAQALPVTVSEGEFAAWTTAMIAGPSGGQTGAVSNVGDPGDSWHVTTQTNSPVIAFHGGPGLTVDPAGGEILSVAVSLDYLVLGAFGQGMGVYSLALVQDGHVYGAGWFATGASGGWRDASASGLTAGSFSALDGGTGLDFSTGGSVISVGFGTSNVSGSGINVVYDNLVATFEVAGAAVPLPAAAPLTVAGLAALGLVARRRRRA